MPDQPSLAEVAREAGTDPRTVRAYLAGKPIRPTMRARITLAIESTSRRVLPRLDEAACVESRSFVTGVRA